MFYNHPPCRISAKTILFEYDKTQITLTGTRELVITQFLDELKWVYARMGRRRDSQDHAKRDQKLGYEVALGNVSKFEIFF